MSFDEQYGSRERVLWVKTLPCLVCGVSPSENAHVRTRGAGGTYKDIVPLCFTHHREIHSIGNDSFCRKYFLDLEMEAQLIEDMVNNVFLR